MNIVKSAAISVDNDQWVVTDDIVTRNESDIIQFILTPVVKN